MGGGREKNREKGKERKGKGEEKQKVDDREKNREKGKGRKENGSCPGPRREFYWLGGG